MSTYVLELDDVFMVHGLEQFSLLLQQFDSLFVKRFSLNYLAKVKVVD